jgi:hypothetical protein
MGDYGEDAFCHGFDIPQKRLFIRRVKAARAVHDRILQEDLGVPISPLMENHNEMSDLDSSFYSIPQKDRDFLIVEADQGNMDTDWISHGHTIKEVIRDFLKTAILAQVSNAKKLPMDAVFKKEDLDGQDSKSSSRKLLRQAVDGMKIDQIKMGKVVI